MPPKNLLAGVALASIGIAAASPASHPRDPETTGLIERSLQANDALMRGDVDRYRELVPVGNDFTLMAPFGGEPTHGSSLSEERWDAMRRFFRNGSLRQEVVHAYRTADMVVLAIIEHATVEVGGLPAQPWNLRVTLVYRREGERSGRWCTGTPIRWWRASAWKRRPHSRAERCAREPRARRRYDGG